MNTKDKIKEWKQLVVKNPKRLEEEKQVIERYGNLFHPSNLDKLTKEDFKSFLLIRNNRHWDGIHRQSNMLTTDMNKLRAALKILLNENKPIKDRLDILFPKKGENYIKGLGRAIITPILLMVYPNKYGVFNSKSEEGLKNIDMLPDMSRKSFAERYLTVNEELLQIAGDYSLTLWQLDEIIGWIATGHSPISPKDGEKEYLPIDSEDEESYEAYADFGLESHLEEFLVENWSNINLSKKYNILTEDGDIVGQQYVTPVGRIDLLCKSKDNKEWLILELKKGRSSDAVVGQILRYIGWIKENLAKPEQKVRGIIVLGEIDDKLRYSVKTTDNIEILTYSVSFQLKKDK